MWLLMMSLGLSQSSATTYAEIYDLQEITERSSQIVTGTVASRQSYSWDGLIWTTVTLDVEDGLVGSASQTVSFEVPGGSLDGLHLTIPGAPHFETGQDVLVFLEGEELVGFGQGAFSLRSGVAERGLGPILPEGPAAFHIAERLPNRETSSTCLQPKLWDDYADGWTLRGLTHMVAYSDSLEVRSTHLIAGLEYRLQICGDTHLNGSSLVLTDADGQVLHDSASAGREGVLLFTPTETAEYRVALRAQGLPEAAVASSVSISVAYR
jgi:hypothetical protein